MSDDILRFDPTRRPSGRDLASRVRRTTGTPPAVTLAVRALDVSPGELSTHDFVRHAAVYAVLRFARGFYRTRGVSVAGTRQRLGRLSADLFLTAFGRFLPTVEEVEGSLRWLAERGVAEEVTPGQWVERRSRAKVKGVADAD